MIQILLFALLLGLALLIVSVPPADGARMDAAQRRTRGPEAAGDAEGKSDARPSRARYVAVAVVMVLLPSAWGAWRWSTVSRSNQEPVRVAVMPFVTAGPQEPYVALALTEEVATRLAQGEIGVASLSAVRALVAEGRSDEVAGELDADYLIEGSVSVAGSGAAAQLIVRARLVEVGTAAQVWSQVYDEPAEQIFAVERRIAERVARAIDVPLTRPAGVGLVDATTENYAAYETYLEGLSHRRRVRDPAHALRARALFARARDLAPEFAPSTAALATVYTWLAVQHDFSVPMDSVVMLRDEALELAPDDTDVVLASALIQWTLASDYEGSIARYEELQPHVDPFRLPIIRGFLRDLHWSVGEKDAALDWGAAALEADPYMGTVWVGQARLLVRAGRIEEGLALLDRGSTGEQDPRTDRLRVLAPLLTDGDTTAAWRAFAGLPGETRAPQLLQGLRPAGRALGRVFSDRLQVADLAPSRESSSPATLAGAGLMRGLLHADRGDPERAHPELQQALDTFGELLRRPGDLAPYTRVRVGIGRALALAGMKRPDEARSALAAVEAGLPGQRDDMLREEYLLGRAEILARIGDLDAARGAWEEALELPSLVSVALASVDPLWSRVVTP